MVRIAMEIIQDHANIAAAFANVAKQLLEQQHAEKQHNDHESYELTWAGQDDANAYKKQMAEERRQSYENRNAEGSRQKQLLEQQHAEKQHDDHESYDLTWAGQDDANAYKK